jgi:hypothetical protein
VKIPEIQYNLDIFLGKDYCGSCCKPLKTESEVKSHSCPLIKPADITLKDVLDNFLRQENLSQRFVMHVSCQGCSQSLSPFSEGYLKVEKKINEKSSELSFRIDDMIQSIKKHHWENSPKCNKSRINMEKMPNNFLIMMEPKTVTKFESTLSYGTTEYKYAAQVNFNTGIISNHFSTTAVIADGTYIEYTGKKCKKLEVPEVSKCVLMLYVQQNSELTQMNFFTMRIQISSFQNIIKSIMIKIQRRLKNA